MRRLRILAARLARSGAIVRLAAIAVLALCASPASAHEVRPAYLQVTQATGDLYDVLFKTPMRGDLRLALDIVFSGKTEMATPVLSRMTGDALVQTWRIRAVEPLPGQTVAIRGLETTLTDALVRVAFADGRAWVQRLTPAEPEAVIPAAPASWVVAQTYLGLGIEHILLGFDHLLFVLGLLLLTNGTRRLVGAITAFTLAHSITLAAATLGFVHVPAKPVEAVIALSIVFVAAEVLRARAGRASLAATMPWLVAFCFGLLHGFGFAGALSEIGMPEGQVPLALLFFNLGVELGQLLFVAAVLAALWLAARARTRVALPRLPSSAVPYCIGMIATFWMVQRIWAF